MLKVLLLQKNFRGHLFIPYSQGGRNGITNWIDGVFGRLGMIVSLLNGKPVLYFGIRMLVKIFTHQLHEILRRYLGEHPRRILIIPLSLETSLLVHALFLVNLC